MNLSEYQEWIDDADMTEQQRYRISVLLQNVRLDDHQSNHLKLFFLHSSKKKAENIIKWLEQLQIDRIDAGFNYSQTDIKEKLKKL